ncbi:MAG: restriction endonuclease [Acidobacteriota bacterium]|nr:restriction endonuclease [Acidobacteriota bacterium]
MKVNFKQEFEKKLSEHSLTYRVQGIIADDNRIYPLGTDTKVLSTVFELVSRPLIYEVARDYKLQVKEPRAQNIYPDFTLMRDASDKKKIAVDVKTTYRERNRKVSFTLGGYTSFIREQSKEKNIEFPFDEYAEHWVIGFIYRRKAPEEIPAHVYDLKDLHKIPIPFEDVQVFVQEKWKIAGDSAGSGNTTNIGSVSGALEDFRQGRGVFSSEEEFLDYWRNYGRTAAERRNSYSDIEGYRDWKKKRR